MENPEKIHKLRLAEMHLDRAIRIFIEEREYPCAITLAAVADEVLGKYVASAGGKTSMDYLLDKLILEPALEGISQKRIRDQYMNAPKNNLKHHGKNSEDHLVLTWQTDAISMILRAATNFKALNNGKLSPYIIAFVKNIQADRPDLFKNRSQSDLNKLSSMLK